MIRVTLKSLLGHKLRFALTGLAIALGVAFMAGTSIFSATLHRGFDDLVDTGLAGTDVVVRSPEAFRSSWGEQREPVDVSLLDRLLKVNGVAAGDVSVEGYAQMVDADGDAVKTPGGNPPTLGMNWIDDPQLSSWNLTTGRPPRGDDEIVVDARSAKQAHFRVGDHVTVLTQAGAASYRLVGIAKWGEVDTPMGATVVLFTRTTAQQVVGQPGKAGSIGLAAAPGTSQPELRDRVATALRGSSLEVLTGKAA